jgi:Uma2 family endonuclease
MGTPQRVTLRYEVEPIHDDWALSEEPVPESSPHEIVSDRIKQLLAAWAARSGRRLKVGRNLAVRWDEAHPQVGADPDVYVVEIPPDGDDVTSLRLWEEGHRPPLLVVEVVSPSRAQKDYFASPEKYAASGTQELWVFDPKLAGPAIHGGPYRIQMWRRTDVGFTRVYAGEGPVWSAAINGFLFVVDEGRGLRIASDREGTDWWMTAEEAERDAKENALRALGVERTEKENALRALGVERTEKENALRTLGVERAEKKAERAAKDAALQRLAELEEQLARARRAD